MKASEIESMMIGMAPVIRQFIAESTAQIEIRSSSMLAQIEAKLADVKKQLSAEKVGVSEATLKQLTEQVRSIQEAKPTAFPEVLELLAEVRASQKSADGEVARRAEHEALLAKQTEAEARLSEEIRALKRAAEDETCRRSEQEAALAAEKAKASEVESRILEEMSTFKAAAENDARLRVEQDAKRAAESESRVLDELKLLKAATEEAARKVADQEASRSAEQAMELESERQMRALCEALRVRASGEINAD